MGRECYSNPGSNMEERSGDVNDTEDTISGSFFLSYQCMMQCFVNKTIKSGVLFTLNKKTNKMFL